MKKTLVSKKENCLCSSGQDVLRIFADCCNYYTAVTSYLNPFSFISVYNYLIPRSFSIAVNMAGPIEATLSSQLHPFYPLDIKICFAQLQVIFTARRKASQKPKSAYVVEKTSSGGRSRNFQLKTQLLNAMPEEKQYNMLREKKNYTRLASPMKRNCQIFLAMTPLKT